MSEINDVWSHEERISEQLIKEELNHRPWVSVGTIMSTGNVHSEKDAASSLK
jgi:hypothetical protein